MQKNIKNVLKTKQLVHYLPFGVISVIGVNGALKTINKNN